MRCDFCAIAIQPREEAWGFLSEEFWAELATPRGPIKAHMDEGWLACAVCYRLILADDVDGLAARDQLEFSPAQVDAAARFIGVPKDEFDRSRRDTIRQFWRGWVHLGRPAPTWDGPQ